jgi:hypothetical protein
MRRSAAIEFIDDTNRAGLCIRHERRHRVGRSPRRINQDYTRNGCRVGRKAPNRQALLIGAPHLKVVLSESNDWRKGVLAGNGNVENDPWCDQLGTST